MAQAFVTTTTADREAAGGYRAARSLVIAIIGPVRIHRENLAAALGQVAGIDVIGTAATLDDLGNAVMPDVVLVDAYGRYDVQLIPAPRTDRPGLRTVVLGAPEDDETIIACVTAGVAGFRRLRRKPARRRHDRNGRRPRRLRLPATSDRRVAAPDRRSRWTSG